MHSNLLSFFKTILLHPRTTGAILPSSPYLARAMAKQIDLSSSGYVLELGPGTGVITKAILKHGVSPDQLILLELDYDLTHHLSTEFPAISVMNGNALQLTQHVIHQKPIHTIISSLPLRSFNQADREKIFSEITSVLSPHGKYIQFSYSLKNDDDYYPPHFKLIDSFIIWRNIPPAKVNVFEI